MSAGAQCGLPVAFIPARGGSRRLPRKNILPLAGQPMLARVIACAQQSVLFARIYVSTDDKDIAEIAGRSGAEVLERPADLTGYDVAVSQIALRFCRDILLPQGIDAFCCLYATAGLLDVEDLQRSYARFCAADRPDVVMGVSRFRIHPYQAMEDQDGWLRLVHPEYRRVKSQDYPPYYASNGTLYWARTAEFMRMGDFYGDRVVGYVVPPDRAVDIDTPEDYALAEALAEARRAPGAVRHVETRK